MPPRTKARGTSNTNARGSAQARRARKHFLLNKYGDGTTASCYRCPTILDFETITVDRIIPGCEGGTYRRSNIRPACAPCNMQTGGQLGAARRTFNKLSHQPESS